MIDKNKPVRAAEERRRKDQVTEEPKSYATARDRDATQDQVHHRLPVSAWFSYMFVVGKSSNWTELLRSSNGQPVEDSSVNFRRNRALHDSVGRSGFA